MAFKEIRQLNNGDIIKIRNKMAKKAVKFFQVNFTKQGKRDSGFTRWKDRQVSTNKPMLFDTGKMKKSFKIVNKSVDIFQIINTADYSGFHNEGTENLPKREILYESEELMGELNDIILDEVSKILGFK